MTSVTTRRINLLQLPNATQGRFLLLALIVLVFTYSLGQTLPVIPKYVNSPTYPTYMIPFFNGAVGALVAIIAAIAHYLLHPLVRARSFGPCQDLEQNCLTSQRIGMLCQRLNVSTPNVLIDSNILNYDALAFGLPWQKTLLMGRGLKLLLATQPDQFDARIAHELGHIKNKDIGITFLAQGLIAIMTLGILIVIAQWLVTSASIFIEGWYKWRLAGATASSFLLDWSNWIFRTLLAGFLLLMEILFWTAILLIEHRSFLRMRELYADNYGAQVVGSETFKKALGNVEQTNGRRTWLDMSAAAHPTIPSRKAAIDDPIKLLEPTPPNLAAAGFVFALLMNSIHMIRDVPDLGSPGGLEALIKTMFRTPEGIVTNIFFSLLAFAPIVALGSLTFRTASWIFLNGDDLTINALQSLKGVLWFLVGLLVGCSFSPITIHKLTVSIIVSQTDFGSFLPGVSQLILSVGLAAIFLIGLFSYFWVMKRLLTAPSIAPPSRATWFAISLTWFMSIGYVSEAPAVLFDPDVARRGDTYEVVASVLGLAAVMWLLGYLCARRTISLRPQPFTSVAPWVCQSQIVK